MTSERCNVIKISLLITISLLLCYVYLLDSSIPRVFHIYSKKIKKNDHSNFLTTDPAYHVLTPLIKFNESKLLNRLINFRRMSDNSLTDSKKETMLDVNQINGDQELTSKSSTNINVNNLNINRETEVNNVGSNDETTPFDVDILLNELLGNKTELKPLNYSGLAETGSNNSNIGPTTLKQLNIGLTTQGSEATSEKMPSTPIEASLTENPNKGHLSLRVYDQPVTIFNYSFITTLEHKCNEDIDVLYLITSYIVNFDRRLAIRETWGLENRVYPNGAKIRRVFLMGMDPNYPNIRKLILEENTKFQDIVFADYVDVYENNTIKCMSGIEWARKFCPNSKFYVRTDDDSFYSTVNLLKFLKDTPAYDSAANFPSLYTSFVKRKFLFYGGYLFPGSNPMRSGKWTATMQQYPYDVYPKYVNGHAIIMSRDLLDEIHEAAKYTKFFWLDDVYFGILAAYIGVSPTHIDKVVAAHPNPDPNISIFDDLIATHYVPSANDTVTIWKLLKARGHA